LSEERRRSVVGPKTNASAEGSAESSWRDRRRRFGTADRVATGTFPPIVVVSLLFVAILQWVDLFARTAFSPNHPNPRNVASLDAFWVFWDGNSGGLSLAAAVTLVIVLLVVTLWLAWRGQQLSGRRGGLILLPYLGTALLLAHLLFALEGLSKIESNYRVIPITDDASVREFFTETRRE